MDWPVPKPNLGMAIGLTGERRSNGGGKRLELRRQNAIKLEGGVPAGERPIGENPRILQFFTDFYSFLHQKKDVMSNRSKPSESGNCARKADESPTIQTNPG
jgi:hypothetical protein